MTTTKSTVLPTDQLPQGITASMAAQGLNGYTIHLDVTDSGTVVVRVRHATTGKVHANVQLAQANAAFLAGWLNYETNTALPAPKRKRKHRALDGTSHKPTKTA